MPDERQEWSCFVRKANIEYLDLISHQDKFFTRSATRDKPSKRTSPRMVLTSSCQSLMIFKYVMEFEYLENASLRSVCPAARVRVSKRLMKPLREPVYTSH